MRTLKGFENTIYNSILSKQFCIFFGEPKTSNLKYVRILCTNIP